ncbi:hypothetical protein H5410_040004 [Solanum commersonii]|uniref:Uncharacterized protein n=1 Tax=Solanum commersonii TaxID=4109 RepID=A0A9J5XNU3_SOLCO|nr:hypothetical protein H5410_040004 [Solanum commersonii]
MTCFICKKTGHNKVVCAKYGSGRTSQPDSKRKSSQQKHNQVNKVLFVVTPLLCQELLKQEQD